jgi:hypothetical protein
MSTLARVILFIMTFFFAHAFLYKATSVFLESGETKWSAPLLHVATLLISIVLAWLVWLRLEPDGVIPDKKQSALLGAVILGFIGFYAGFAGPLMLTPESNQGPLIGILFTGPLGFLLGGLLGLVYWMVRGRKAGGSGID